MSLPICFAHWRTLSQSLHHHTHVPGPRKLFCGSMCRLWLTDATLPPVCDEPQHIADWDDTCRLTSRVKLQQQATHSMETAVQYVQQHLQALPIMGNLWRVGSLQSPGACDRISTTNCYDKDGNMVTDIPDCTADIVSISIIPADLRQSISRMGQLNRLTAHILSLTDPYRIPCTVQLCAHWCS